MNEQFQNIIVKYQEMDSVSLWCEIHIDALFSEQRGKQRFLRRFNQFMACNKLYQDIFQYPDGKLVYQSEQLIPQKDNGKPFLLLVFGNPACHSIRSGMFFAYEGKQKEHRFWKILRESKVVDLGSPTDNPNMAGERRKKNLLDLNYQSRFQIGLSVLITFPSPSTGPWSGVAGVKKLFGANAFKRIAQVETKRLVQLARRRIKTNGAVITFQKDAWFHLSAAIGTKDYLKKAKAALLNGLIENQIPIYGLPPTRYPARCGNNLKQVAEKIAPH